MATNNYDEILKKLSSLYSDVENNIKMIDTSVIVKGGKNLYETVSTLAERGIVGAKGFQEDIGLAYDRKKRRLKRRIMFVKIILSIFMLYIVFHFFIKTLGEIKHFFGL